MMSHFEEGAGPSNLCPNCSVLQGWQTLDDVQRKFLQFITFIKLKTPNIKKTHQTSFIFSLTLQNMNIAMHCSGRKENLMQ